MKWFCAISTNWAFRARGPQGPIGVVYSRPSVAEPGVTRSPGRRGVMKISD
jgi:hypothetical protein